jgi:hypothetical protein
LVVRAPKGTTLNDAAMRAAIARTVARAKALPDVVGVISAH